MSALEKVIMGGRFTIVRERYGMTPNRDNRVLAAGTS